MRLHHAAIVVTRTKYLERALKISPALDERHTCQATIADSGSMSIRTDNQRNNPGNPVVAAASATIQNASMAQIQAVDARTEPRVHAYTSGSDRAMNLRSGPADVALRTWRRNPA